MAGHKTHSAAGVAIAAVLAGTTTLVGSIPPAQQPLLLACGMAAGLAPDLDSDTSRPLMILKSAVGVAVVGAVLVDSLSQGLPTPDVVARTGLALGLVTLLFVVFTRLTVHRGIMHSVPFVCLWALLTMQATHTFGGALSLAAGLVALIAGLGHLVLDELWSIELRGGLVPRLKPTFGTAFKFWSGSVLATLVCYAGLAGMLWLQVSRT
ncbi:MAG: metal-dependent hydrolase [Pedobacter sp.]